MISVGNNNIKDVYLGGRRIYQIYCGSSLVYNYASVVINNVRTVYSSGNMLSANGQNYVRVIADVIETVGSVSTLYTDVELTPSGVSSARLIINGNYIYGEYLGSSILPLYSEYVNYTYHGLGSESVQIRQAGNSVYKTFNISINSSAEIPASGAVRYIDVGNMNLYYSSGYSTSETIDRDDVVFDSIVSSESAQQSAQVDYGTTHDFDVYFPDFYKTLINSGYYDISCSVNGVNSNTIRINHSYNGVRISNELYCMVYGSRCDYWEMDDASAGIVPVRLYEATIQRYTSGAETVNGDYTSAAGWTVYDDYGMINRVDETSDSTSTKYNVYINAISSGDRSSSIEFESGNNTCSIEFYQEYSSPDPEIESESEIENEQPIESESNYEDPDIEIESESE